MTNPTSAYRVTHMRWAGEFVSEHSVRHFLNPENAIALARKIGKIQSPIEFATDGLSPLWEIGREGTRHLKIDLITFEDAEE